MKSILQKLFLSAALLISATHVFAQDDWPSPEVGQMYRHAREYMAAGNFKDAAITYRQAIILAPKIMMLYKELGDALYHEGNYDEAEKVLEPLLLKPGVDTQCYRLLAMVQSAKGDAKHALKTLKNGLTKYPSSGMLYNEMGWVYTHEKDEEAALNAWLDGINNDPGFAKNYINAANVYLGSGKVLRGILYSEMFLAMQHDTVHEDELKSKLFVAYKTMFYNIAEGETPEYGKAQKQPAVNTFEDAVLQVYTSLTPVVSDGITTENLTMVRTRFLMDWFTLHAKKYPFSLFSYQDKVIRNGRFDAYNEWLFGKAESTVQYKAWTEFHQGDMERFLKWKNTNQYIPTASDLYNDRNMKGIFGKKKK